MSGSIQRGRGVGVYPSGAENQKNRDSKTPGSRNLTIPPYRAERRVSRPRGVIRTPLPPWPEISGPDVSNCKERILTNER